MNVVMSKTNHLSLLIPIFIYFSNGGVTAGNKKDVVDNNKNEHDIPLLQTKQGDCISPAHVRCTNFEQAEAFDAHANHGDHAIIIMIMTLSSKRVLC